MLKMRQFVMLSFIAVLVLTLGWGTSILLKPPIDGWYSSKAMTPLAVGAHGYLYFDHGLLWAVHVMNSGDINAINHGWYESCGNNSYVLHVWPYMTSLRSSTNMAGNKNREFVTPVCHISVHVTWSGMYVGKNREDSKDQPGGLDFFSQRSRSPIPKCSQVEYTMLADDGRLTFEVRR